MRKNKKSIVKWFGNSSSDCSGEYYYNGTDSAYIEIGDLNNRFQYKANISPIYSPRGSKKLYAVSISIKLSDYDNYSQIGEREVVGLKRDASDVVIRMIKDFESNPERVDKVLKNYFSKSRSTLFAKTAEGYKPIVSFWEGSRLNSMHEASKELKLNSPYSKFFKLNIENPTRSYIIEFSGGCSVTSSKREEVEKELVKILLHIK